MPTALRINQGIDFNQHIFQGAPPAPLVLLSGQAFHFSYIINVFLSLSPPCSKKVFIYLKFKITKIQAVSSSAAVSNVTVLCE